MKRNEVIKRLRRAARAADLEFEEFELKNHTGIRVGSVRSTLGRHAEIDDVTARKFFDQFAEALGKGWWR